MLKLLPLLFLWYRMGAFTKPWAAPGASDADYNAMRRATRTAFYIMLGFSLLGFIGPALFPVLRHSEAAQTFSTITVIVGFAISLVFDIKAELLRQRGKGVKRQSVYFPPAWLKKSERFSRGVEKFIAYQRDLMPENKLSAVLEAREEYDRVLRNPDKEALEGMEKKVLKVCESAVPEYNASPLKENLEVIIVAIIVALGIRAYYLQPFKIPTASMQPTLNGIIASRLEGEETSPNFLKQSLEYVWNGRNYVNMEVPKEWGETEVVAYQQYSRMNFFTFTEVEFSNGQKLKAYAPAKQLLGGVDHRDGRNDVVGMWRTDNYTSLATNAGSDDTNGWIRLQPQKVKGGDVLARGYVESGDQLLVDKFSYHFRNPRRDEVFVFSTRDIPIPNQKTPQHYIKRLVALPGDKVEIDAPSLLVNGEKVTAPGSTKVMSEQDGYPGYRITPMTEYVRMRENAPGIEVSYPKPGYTALGDNSSNSLDSRYWGPVPEKNIVGPAMFVYWPFSNHWGLIP